MNDVFDVFIPVGATKVVANDSTWDGKGITPDVAVAANDALLAAHRAAIQKLIADHKDAGRRRELEWIAAWLQSTAKPAQLERWAGKYGTRVITFADGSLFQSVDKGPNRRLLPLDASTFLVNGAEHTRLHFTPNQLIVEFSSGRKDVVSR